MPQQAEHVALPVLTPVRASSKIGRFAQLHHHNRLPRWLCDNQRRTVGLDGHTTHPAVDGDAVQQRTIAGAKHHNPAPAGVGDVEQTAVQCQTRGLAQVTQEAAVPLATH